MQDSQTIYTVDDVDFNKYLPIITGICGLVSIILFIGINLDSNPGSWATYKRWGAPSATDIFNGDIWGLISSNFLHTEIWHIFLNLGAFWSFGKKIEFEESKLFYIVLIISSALVSSIAQLSFSNNTGIGLSGIVYAFCGYIYIKGKLSSNYKLYINNSNFNFFIIWLFVCILITQLNLLSVGNAAHIAGLLWGILIAYSSKYGKIIQTAISTISFTILASSIFWNPLSTAWLSHQAYMLHDKQQLNEAMILYKEILTKDPENEFAKTNLKQLEVAELSKQAYKLHENKNYDEAISLYKQILRKDPDNEFAKTNLNQLEIYNLSQKAFFFHTIKNYDSARFYYNKIIEITPNDTFAIENLKDLPQ